MLLSNRRFPFCLSRHYITHPFIRLKSANPAKQEQARLEVENAEDDLVQKTEVAITLMKTVLENVSHFWPVPFYSYPPTF